MTISITNQDPAPSAVDASPYVFPSLMIASDAPLAPVDRDTIDVWINGTQFVAGGVAVFDTTVITGDEIGGFAITMQPLAPFPSEEPVTVRVVADDTDAASPIDSSWSFTVTDVTGPVLTDHSLPPYAITTAVPVNILFRITDPGTGYDPQLSVLDFTASSANVQFAHPLIVGGGAGTPANQVSFTPVSDNDTFLGREGALIEVTSGVDTGERRRIVSVQGPGLATYDGAQLSGTSVTVKVYDERGLDIVIDGERVFHSGFLDSDAAANGWSGTATVNGDNDIDVALAVPGGVSSAWVDGTRVPVQVRVSDDNAVARNISDINYFFDVGDLRGPQIVNVSPAEGTRGLSVSSPGSDIYFEITCSKGVDTATLNIAVNGVAAVTAGTPTGNYSGSSIGSVTGGISVTLVNASSYTDGEITFVDITVDDNDGNPGERRVLRFHYGTANSDAVVGSGTFTDAVRVIAFDISDTSFGNPKELRHNGYAADGIWYEDGSPSADNVASWFTELGSFPASGHIVVSAADGWGIFKPATTSPWMTCAPATSPAWSMAGNDTELLDADFGPQPVLVLAGTDGVIVVDFVNDSAVRYTSTGAETSSSNISARASNQSGSEDASLALPAGPYTKVASVHDQFDDESHAVIAIGTSGALSLVQDLGTQLAAALYTRDAAVFTPASVTTRVFTGTWQRLRLGTLGEYDVIVPMLVAYNDSGQGQVEVWDWHKFSLQRSVELFLDDASTPALAAAEVRDIDIVVNRDEAQDLRVTLAAMMVGELDVIDYDVAIPASSTVSAYSETTLGLNGVSGAETSAVVLGPDANADKGYLYAAVSKPPTPGSASNENLGAGGDWVDQGGGVYTLDAFADFGPITPGTLTVFDAQGRTGADNGAGVIVDTGGLGYIEGTVNYTTRAISLIIYAGIPDTTLISYSYVSGDGRVTRFRIHSPSAANRSKQMSSGTPVLSLSAIGTTIDTTSRYVRTRMSIVDP